MFSSDNACYSWYYTARFWAPWWAEQINMVFPEAGMLVMNHCRQLHVAPCYDLECNNRACPKRRKIHSFRFKNSQTAKDWFLNEDWSKRNTWVYYDDSVLTFTFTHHARSLTLVARSLYLL
jgi:hypothetical protein